MLGATRLYWITSSESDQSPTAASGRVRVGSWLCENSSGRATRRNISGQLHPSESNHTAHARFDALLENCVFYILRMYEFLYRVGQKRPWCHVGSNVWFARKETSIDGRRGAIPVIERHSPNGIY